ncbi:unnamed protein product [Moneuplotes crassus]|uniref:Uncharacterized protein n=1 Tax=Euplotes crassus TaxID=5936 RepID=A0AAD1XP69_EUPCR|nr:unnamed protein product [Moneuplotes crassus]
MQTYQGNKRVMATYYDLPFDPRTLNLALPLKLQGTIEEPLPALNTLARSQGQPLYWGASMSIFPNCPENLSFNCPQPTHQPMFMNDFQAKPNVYQIECSSKGYPEEFPEIYEQQKETSKPLNLEENKTSILSNEKKVCRVIFRLFSSMVCNWCCYESPALKALSLET